MRKWILWAGAGVAAVAATLACIWLWPRTYELSPEYYGTSEFESVDAAGLKTLLDEKKSFALLIYQPSCRASEDFEKIVEEFSEKEKISFEKIVFSEAKNSGEVAGLEYYPSVALYRDGQLQTFLKTDEDEDLAAYQSLDGFTSWWKKYVKMGEE